MDWLNYHHLYYFSVIAEEGGVSQAAQKLRLTHSTLSAQLRSLEDHFGAPLFERRGRRLVLTPFGVETASYAADIFRLGRELTDVARGRARNGRDVLRIGVSPGIPKTMVQRLLAPALAHLSKDGSALIQQGPPRGLVESLALGKLHLVLTNDVPSFRTDTKLHTHVLGQTKISLYGHPSLARAARRRFPALLPEFPFVLPPIGWALRRSLDEWFASHSLRVVARIEVDDSGLLRAFGNAGLGIIPVRAALQSEVEGLAKLRFIGQCEGVVESYYALSTERRITHPALATLVDGVRADLQGSVNSEG